VVTLRTHRVVTGSCGIFSLNVGSLPSGNLDAIETVLNPVETGHGGDTYAGGFTQSQSVRVHNGSLLIDDVVAAETVNLSTDNGNIEVTATGRIDATAPGTGSSIPQPSRNCRTGFPSPH